LPAKEQAGRTPFAPRCLKDVVEERLFAHRQDLFTRLEPAILASKPHTITAETWTPEKEQTFIP
jgi:hypothetical protein